MVPRNVARISEYVANSGWSPDPAPAISGAAQVALSSRGTPSARGTGAPAGKVSRVSPRTSCRPLPRVTSPSRGRPSTVPRAVTVTGSSTTIRTSACTSTVVRSTKDGAVGAVSEPTRGSSASRQCHAVSSTIAGSAIAVTFTQYWNACTNVMLRIPPVATLAVTTTPTTTAPSQDGAPVTVDSVRPAPCNCGTR